VNENKISFIQKNNPIPQFHGSNLYFPEFGIKSAIIDTPNP
jgi:hypothetical protein